MKSIHLCGLVAACVAAAGCSFTAESYRLNDTPEAAFYLEARMIRDGSYMWDDSADRREYWAVNRGSRDFCVVFREPDSSYVSAKFWVPAGQTMRLMESNMASTINTRVSTREGC